MSFPRFPLSGAGLLAASCLALLGACSGPSGQTPEQRAAQATMSACRQRADAVFSQQNRATIFNNRMDDPGSSGYMSGITTRGLSDRFAWDQNVSDCVRNEGSAEAAGPGIAPNPRLTPVITTAPASK